HNGSPELIAWFMCFGTVGQSGEPGSGGDSQVVAFTRDTTGAIVVLGQVVTTFDGPIKSVSRIGVSGTDVSMEVGDWFCCEGAGERPAHRDAAAHSHQPRTGSGRRG